MDKKEFHEELKRHLDEVHKEEELATFLRKEAKLKNKKSANNWRTTGIISALCSLWSFFNGFWKISVYQNTEGNYLNVYVGGDAYNYIINACQATAFWVLSGVFLIGAFGCAFVYYTKKKRI